MLWMQNSDCQTDFVIALKYIWISFIYCVEYDNQTEVNILVSSPSCSYTYTNSVTFGILKNMSPE